MKLISIALIIAIFSIFSIAQPKIGIPFSLKKDETVEIGQLKIKYLGAENEWALGWDSKGKRIEINYRRFGFEIEKDGKKQKFKEVFNFKVNDLVVEILGTRIPEKMEDISPETIKIEVKTAKEFKKTEENDFDVSNSVEKLEIIKTFAIGPIGYAGVTSEGEKLTLKILESERANYHFEKILKDGTNEAKLYALWALRKIHGRQSDKLFKPFRNLSVEVKTMSGCIIGMEKFSETLKIIEKPFYLQIPTKQLWQMDLEQRKKLLTTEEERFLLMIFRSYKSLGELDKIADVPFGDLFEREAAKVL